MIGALKTGLLDAAATATGFSASRVAFAEVPLKFVYPYLVIFGVNGLFERDAVNHHERFRLQFAVRAKTGDAVATAGEAMQAVFDFGESNLTVVGWTVLEVTRTDPQLLARKFGKVWTWDFDYNFWIYKAR